MKNHQFVAACVLMGMFVFFVNALVAIPINSWFTYGTFIFPICFVITDTVNHFYGAQSTRKVVLYGFAIGVVLSIAFADMRIALASAFAFIAVQMLDASIFNRLRQAMWWQAPVISSVILSVVDTALFFTLAFVGTGKPWVTWALGSLVLKHMVIPAYRVFLASLPPTNAG